MARRRRTDASILRLVSTCLSAAFVHRPLDIHGHIFGVMDKGAVARPSSRSAPAGFPSSAPLIVYAAALHDLLIKLADFRYVFCRYCMNSPSIRFAITVASSSVTSGSFNLANATDALPSKKSPANTAILLPNAILADSFPLLDIELSITSSCSRDAVWMSSVISANLLCEGNTELSWMSSFSTLPAVSGELGLASASTDAGVMGLSTSSAPRAHIRDCFGIVAVACDINSTSIGPVTQPPPSRIAFEGGCHGRPVVEAPAAAAGLDIWDTRSEHKSVPRNLSSVSLYRRSPS
ncbi:hypothetical protein KC330_g132 [Hortaea werneckii]|nr:hypothetical protein KC330_g132 [Hortaea werneckii]